MTTPAYYKDGVSYTADGQVIITITRGQGTCGRPEIPANPWTDSNAPFPVFVPWGPTHGGGSIAYDPNKVVFSGLSALRDSQTKINQILEQARSAYPQNAEQARENKSSTEKYRRQITPFEIL